MNDMCDGGDVIDIDEKNRTVQTEIAPGLCYCQKIYMGSNESNSSEKFFRTTEIHFNTHQAQSVTLLVQRHLQSSLV
jgi:hypothetical protein